MTVELVDSRRLTGANIHARAPGAVLELRFDTRPDPVAAWQRWIREGLRELGWTSELHVRRFVDHRGRAGVELMLTAPVDRLYAATDLNEWALARALDLIDEQQAEAGLAEITSRAQAEQAARRGVVELIAAAEERGVMWLLDDDQLSLGQFGDAQSWGVSALPEPAAVDWTKFRRRPLALITGTNGKTTTTRLLARMLRKHGLRVGNTSTDGLCVDERLIDAGDWTGPGGARAILRRPEIDVALLEAARGGLLRRGVGVPWADVAVITNVAEDHLGEYGVFDLASMAAAKGVIASVVGPSGRVVIGADSPALLEWARGRTLPAPVVYFSLDPSHPQLDSPQEAWTVVDGWLVRREAGVTTRLSAIDEMPLSLGGRARHNVANALAAAGAAQGLGASDQATAAALLEFGSAPDDNPGRARVWLVRRGAAYVRVLVDFAHNLAGIAAIAELARELGSPGPGPALCFGMAGDRSDDELRALGAALTRFDPSLVILREQPHYLRGRELGEVPRLIEQGLLAAGFARERLGFAEGEPASIEQALDAGAELVVVLVHTEHEAVARWLEARGAQLESPR
jgi:cyanophycin synthetase